MRKKFISVLMCSLLAIECIGCGGASSSSGSSSSSSSSSTSASSSVSTSASTSDKEIAEGVIDEEPRVKASDLKIEGSCAAPDSIGTVYFNATMTNNSKYPITFANICYEVDGQDAYLTITDTVMPGEKSAQANCFGSKDMKMKSMSYTIFDKTTKLKCIVDYDCQLDTYKSYGWFKE